mmetsp:Transcript_28405/g.28709  ORF Transcript_28405/g.28709 Transcript_28405/m.28709 type:complete len:182 (+) Transcript_28405:142-687(+)
MSSEGLVNETKQITSSLKRVRTQLEAEVLQIGEASKALDHDGDLLKETYEEHAYHLKGSLASAKRRLLSVKTNALLEKYSVFGSLLFFTAVVLHIIIKRTRILVWIWFIISSCLSKILSKPNQLNPQNVTKPIEMHKLNDSLTNYTDFIAIDSQTIVESLDTIDGKECEKSVEETCQEVPP